MGIALRSTGSDCTGVVHQGSALGIHAVSEYIFSDVRACGDPSCEVM